MCNRQSALVAASEPRRGEEEINTLSRGLAQFAAARGLTPNLGVDAGFSLWPWSLRLLRTWKKEP